MTDRQAAELMGSSGYDGRVARAYTGLGYNQFPFAAFDESGRLLDPGMSLPPDKREAVGRVVTLPAWAELYRSLSILDDPGWDAYMSGLAFVGDTVRVSVFKSLNSVAFDAQKAHNWALSYDGVVAKSLSDYAGQSHVVDPKWKAVLESAIDHYPKDDKDNGQGGDVEATADGDVPAGAAPVGEAAALPWVLFGLRILAAVMDVAVRTKVLTTVVWYVGDPYGPWSNEWGSQWSPIHVSYGSSRRRTVHCLWNPAWPKTNGAYAWLMGNVAWRGFGVTDMPHTIGQYCRAFYPTADCGAAFAGGDGPRAAGPDVEPVAPPRPTGG